MENLDNHGGGASPEGTAEVLADVRGMPLRELITSDDSVLTAALRRLVRPAQDYAAFSSAVPGEEPH